MSLFDGNQQQIEWYPFFSYSIFFLQFLDGMTNFDEDSVSGVGSGGIFSDTLMEEIKALVHRHPDKLYMEVIGSQNKGYRVEMTVVTYCRNRKEIDDRSKYRVLLIIACLPEFWSAWKGAHHI